MHASRCSRTVRCSANPAICSNGTESAPALLTQDSAEVHWVLHRLVVFRELDWLQQRQGKAGDGRSMPASQGDKGSSSGIPGAQAPSMQAGWTYVPHTSQPWPRFIAATTAAGPTHINRLPKGLLGLGVQQAPHNAAALRPDLRGQCMGSGANTQLTCCVASARVEGACTLIAIGAPQPGGTRQLPSPTCSSVFQLSRSSIPGPNCTLWSSKSWLLCSSSSSSCCGACCGSVPGGECGCDAVRRCCCSACCAPDVPAGKQAGLGMLG